MGGKALTTVNTRRYERAEFFRAWDQFATAFRRAFPGVRFALVQALQDKTSFGDMDVVIDGEAMPDNWHEPVASLFGAREVSVRINAESVKAQNGVGFSAANLLGKPFSFHLEELQVDLIPVAGESFEFARRYLSYGDLGSLMGAVYRSLGVHYGGHGLRIAPLDHRGQLLNKNQVALTRDHREALGCIGYDADRFDQGFAELEEVFTFVASSSCFSTAPFLDPKAHNNKRRHRERTRPGYRAFIEWCRANAERYPSEPPLNDAHWRAHFLSRFPAARLACDEVSAQIEAATYRRKRFNGRVLMEVTGLPLAEVGPVAAYLRSGFESTEAFEAWVGEQSDEALREWIRKGCQAYRDSAG